MELTPVSQRYHIAFFGCTNAGKSSVVNAVTNQDLSVVSEIKGTTTDPVKKTMEILPIGAVVIYDTPGFDDISEIGEKRIEKTNQILLKTDVAVLIVDALSGMSAKDKELLEIFEKREIPYLIAYNKSDLIEDKKDDLFYISAKTKENIELLKEKISTLAQTKKTEKFILKDIVNKNDTVILVIPIDESAPKGRLILPQQNTLRELLDIGAISICTQIEELNGVLSNLKNPPKLVITDSQAFNKVKEIVPEEINLTSFSILFARYKGDLKTLIEGANELSQLKDGDKILISEGCTHHRQCNDIGTVKLPNWISKYTGKKLNFEFTQGGDFPTDLSKYSLIVHCGGCMLNEREMKSRIETAKENNIKIVNYGILIAHINDILNRATKVFNGKI